MGGISTRSISIVWMTIYPFTTRLDQHIATLDKEQFEIIRKAVKDLL